MPTQITCALVVMWVLGVAREGGSCFCALLEMFVVQGKSLRHSVLCTRRALDTSPGAIAAAGSLLSLLSLLLCPPEAGGHRSHRDSHSPCIPHPPGCTETQGQGQRVVAQPVHQERPWHSTACQRGGLGISFWGSLAEVPRSWVSGWAGGDGGSPGEMERSLEGAGIRICRGGIVLTDLALVGSVCGAGGVRQLGGIRLPAAQSIKGQEIQKLPSKPCHPAQPGGCLSPPPTPAG